MRNKHYFFQLFFGITLLISLPFVVSAQFAQPFKWDTKSNGRDLLVSVDIPTNYYLYADNRTKITVTDSGMNLIPESVPKTVIHTDEFGSGKIYPAGKQVWKYKIKLGKNYRVVIAFQGCKGNTPESSAICFMPSEKIFSINAQTDEKIAESKKESSSLNTESDVKNESLTSQIRSSVISPEDELDSILDQFDIVNTGGGYLNKKEFLAFLEKDRITFKNKDSSPFADRGIVGMIFLILLGGIALNLTPCVLPMIPINLAIIGAGEVNANKIQGFLRGTFYGIGIAVAYGLLGVVTVFSGAKFGTLNSASWFNFIIASVFVVLALAMFDLFSIDFSRFSTKIGIKKPEKGVLIPIFLMGVVAALLAGACVAPVVIAVLLHSTTLYAEGNVTGLILPFILGVGMALPWPFAGAGIALLPKPGKWMIWVKQIMGVLILIFAIYYIYIGITLLPDNKQQSKAEDSFLSLKKGLLRAKTENKPLFIDFWASWCKNCAQMEKTTFKNPEVIKKLNKFIVIKFQAEKPSQPDVKKLLDRYKIIGLPGYVVLRPIYK